MLCKSHIFFLAINISIYLSIHLSIYQCIIRHSIKYVMHKLKIGKPISAILFLHIIMSSKSSHLILSFSIYISVTHLSYMSIGLRLSVSLSVFIAVYLSVSLSVYLSSILYQMFLSIYKDISVYLFKSTCLF